MGEDTDLALGPKPLSSNGGGLQALTVRQGRMVAPSGTPDQSAWETIPHRTGVQEQVGVRTPPTHKAGAGVA